MNTNGIDQLLGQLRSTAASAAGRPAEPANSSATTTGGLDFAQVLQQSINSVNQTQQQAKAAAEQFSAGDPNANLHEVMVDLQKASLSFQEMVQVRNKLVTAYNDIMNMPV